MRKPELQKPTDISWLLYLIPPWAIVLTQSEAGICTLLVVLVTYFWVHFSPEAWTRRLRWVPAYWATFVVFLTGCTYVFLQEWVDTSGRGKINMSALDFWAKNADPMTGTGAGMTTAFFPYIAKLYGHNYGGADKFAGGYVPLWFHQDYLQLLFEQGWIGLGSLLLVTFFLFRATIHKALLFSLVCGLMTAGIFNMVCHWPFHYVLSTFIVVYCFRTSRD